MPTCIVCRGDRVIDFTMDNVFLSEHLDEDEMRVLRASDQWKNPRRPCDECEGTGVMSQARIDEITSMADDAIAKFMVAALRRGLEAA